MRAILTTVILLLVGIAVGLLWEHAAARRRRTGAASTKGKDGNGGRRTILAYSFQTDLSFADTSRLLTGGGGGESVRAELGDWYERDSAWYPELLSCRSHRGMWMNLYFFDTEKVLELKFVDSTAAQTAAEAFAIQELLPALGAREIKRTESVD